MRALDLYTLYVVSDEEKLGATDRTKCSSCLTTPDVIVAVSEETAFRNFPTTEPRGLVGRESYWF